MSTRFEHLVKLFIRCDDPGHCLHGTEAEYTIYYAESIERLWIDVHRAGWRKLKKAAPGGSKMTICPDCYAASRRGRNPTPVVFR